MKRIDETLQVPRRVRGTLHCLGGDEYEFHPQAEGESQQEVLAQKRRSKVYKTTSAVKPQLVAHLCLPAAQAEADPLASFTDELFDVCKKLATSHIERPPMQRCLKDTASLSVSVDDAGSLVDVSIRLNLEETPNYNQRLVTLIQSAIQCLAINKDFLRPRKS